MLSSPLTSINIAAKPTPLVAGDFLAVGFVESRAMEQPDGGCHVTHTVAKTIPTERWAEYPSTQERVA